MDESDQNLTIKKWADEDRPREKFLLKGRQSLSDAELIAILIGSGTRRETAVELAKRILSGIQYSLHELARLSIPDLMKFKGIGEAKAITIAAAMELGRRRKNGETVVRNRITSSREIYDLLSPQMMDLPHEEFHMLLLNRSNMVIRREFISRGGVAGTVVDPKLIFRSALEHLASSIILCHNHPSGNLKPSPEDIALTRKIKEAGHLLDIAVLDHLIFSDSGYFSFADEGMI